MMRRDGEKSEVSGDEEESVAMSNEKKPKQSARAEKRAERDWPGRQGAGAARQAISFKAWLAKCASLSNTPTHTHTHTHTHSLSLSLTRAHTHTCIHTQTDTHTQPTKDTTLANAQATHFNDRACPFLFRLVRPRSGYGS